jgi:hypothetical protein
MDQEREDYRDTSPVWLPPMGLLVVAVFLLIAGGLVLIGLLASGTVRLR